MVVIGVIFFYLYKSFQTYLQNPHLSKSEEINNRYGRGSKERPSRGFSKDSGGDEFGFFKSAMKDSSPTYKEYKLIVALIAKVAKADGEVCELENELILNMIEDLSRDFPNPEDAKEELLKIFEEENSTRENIEDLALEYVRYTKGEYYKRVKTIEFLLNIGYADLELSKEEEEVIIDIAAFFELSNEDFNRIYGEFEEFFKSVKDRSLESDEAYKILGVEKDASDDEIKKSYRELVKKYHPDIIKGKGLESDFIELATKKLQEINSAYEEIKKERGIK